MKILCASICMLTGIAIAYNEQIASVEFIEPPAANTAFRTLLVSYTKVQPSTDEAIKYLNTTLEHYVRIYPDKDIFAHSAFSVSGTDRDERRILLPDGSSYLYYDAKTKRILTQNQKQGVKSKTTSEPVKNYTVKYEEQTFHPASGPKGTLSIVFSSVPQEEEAYRIIVQELRKAAIAQSKKIETAAYAYIGNLSDPTNMKQIMGSDNIYICVEWNPSDGKIIHKNLRTGLNREFGQITE